MQDNISFFLLHLSFSGSEHVAVGLVDNDQRMLVFTQTPTSETLNQVTRVEVVSIFDLDGLQPFAALSIYQFINYYLLNNSALIFNAENA